MAEAADATPALLPHGPTAVEGLDARIVQRLRDVPAAVVPDLPRGEGWLIVELTGDTAAEVAAKAQARPGRRRRGGLARRHRPRARGGDLADPRGRRGARRPHQRRPPGARRLGGRRRPARAARRVPARVRGAARRARAAGAAVRALRRRLRARADRLPVRPRTRPGPHRLSSLRRGRRPAGGRLRRVDLGRARRRAGAQRAAAARCTPPPRSGCSSGSRGSSTPTTCSTPVCSSGPRGSTTRSGWPRRPGCAPAWRSPTSTTAATSPPPCTAAPASASAGRTCRRGGHVPVLAGHPGGEGHHPRAGPRAAGDAGARGSGPRLALARGARRARPLPVLQGLLARLPDRCRHGDLQGRGAAPVLPAAAAAAPHYTLGPAAPLGRSRRPRSPAGQLRAALPARRPAGEVVGRHGPAPRGAAVRAPHLPAAVGRPRRRLQDGPPVALWVDSFTDHFAPDVAFAAARVLEAAGYRVQVPGADTCCALTWITTGQLDAARKTLGATVATLVRLVDAGIPVVGVEPSCTAVLRGDALELVGGAGGRTAGRRHPDARRAARRHPGLGTAVTGRARGGGPAALPPRVGARLVGRRRAAGPRRRARSPGSAAVAGWPATGAWSAVTTTSR